MKRSISFALSTSVVLGVLAVPSAAFAAAGPTALKVSGHDKQLGRLFVDDLKADSDVTGISAVVHKPGENVAVEWVHNFELASGDKKSGDWITRKDVKLEITGVFAVDLIVREADGDETTLKDVGTYNYTARKYFQEFGVDRPNPTVDDQKVTASGRLAEWQPITHESKPVADSSVRIHNGSYDETVRTDADGRFSDWFIADPRPSPVRAYHGNLSSELLQVAPKGLPARVTLDTSDFSGTFGAPVEVTGKVEYEIDGVWKTTQHADVEVVNAAGTWQGSAVTTEDGRFSLETKIPFAGDKRQLKVSYGDWFSNKPTAPLTFRTTGYSSISQFEIELGFDSKLTVSGLLEVEGAPRPHNKLDIQVSKNGKDGWTKLKTLTLTKDRYFRADIPAPASGHYRAVYSGSATVQGSVSPVLRASRIQTRIKDYKVTPKVKKRGAIAVSGTLQHAAPAWKAYGGRKVMIFFSPKGKPKESYLLGEVKTAANGTFKKSFKERGDGTVFALHINADSKHLMNPKVSGNVDVK
ncbi:hypothetical protein OG883_32405 [Streptomyces sp. NBC_01142]|uniref:hypothetical protein n=1 Tax=Streptomyces sp. NBC_01142 TaxID=2975865 RepID=UPI0022531A29|nr:hypothetical protein [Streptomyces sp. NBC_01142]MCX4824477.1 hypothetical protein [Streptomyces sp. NBC_01142]